WKRISSNPQAANLSPDADQFLVQPAVSIGNIFATRHCDASMRKSEATADFVRRARGRSDWSRVEVHPRKATCSPRTFSAIIRSDYATAALFQSTALRHRAGKMKQPQQGTPPRRTALPNHPSYPAAH